MMVDHGNALDVATTIPELPPGFVARENINMTIDAMLQADVDAVLLQGHDGVGKTTILTSYTRSRAATTVSLFLKPVRVSYELSGVITELYDQFRVLADPRRSISTEGVPTRSDLAALFQRLASRLRASGRCLTVVIDGLADVSYRDRAGATDIIELLPFGRRSFRFLFSGDVEPLLRATGCVWRDYPVTLFSTDETKQLFAGLEVDDGAIVRAHNACNGVVGQLAAVRRLVCSGVQIDEVLQKQPGELSHTMVLEWERAAPLTQVHPQLLAILAFDARSHSVDTLAQISGLSAELTEELVRSATFLDRSASGRIDFVSETFRVFAQRRLASLKQSTLERLIHTMLDNRAAPDTVTALPVLMSEARQFQQLVTLLDPGHFDALVAVTESITAVRSQARLGARSAEINGDDVSFFRFRLLQALASDVLATSDKRNEVAALISVGLRDEALSIARAALFKEQRLRLFSAALATLSDREEDIDASLRDELRQLCASTPLDTLTDEIVDIAADVFMVEPEAAIQLVERFGAISKRANVFDWIMALMSVRHAVRGRKVNVESFDEAAVHDRMTDPHARRFFTGMRLASIGRDADWILDRCETMSEASDRLTALRMWLQANSRRSDAIRVAAVALDLSVQIREFSPSLSVLRQFASVLPYADNVTAASALIARIDALLTSLPHRSPSIEYTRVQLLLARSQKKFGFDGALLRISELSLFIQQLTDPAVKAECMSRLYAHLPDVAPQTDAKRAQIELALLIDEVLTHSATHDDVIAPILQPLVAHQPALSFTFVDRINTDFRRDEVRAALLDELAPDCRTSDAVHLLVHQLDRIGDPLLRARTIVAALAASYKDPDAGPILGRALWQHAVELPAAEYRARAFAYISQAIPTGSSHTAAVEILAGALESIRSPDRRADVTFQVVRVLSVTDADAARRFLDDARTVRMAQAIPFGSVSSFFAATRLACRALRGVFETE